MSINAVWPPLTYITSRLRVNCVQIINIVLHHLIEMTPVELISSLQCLSVSCRPVQQLPQCAEDEAVEDEGERCQTEGPAAPLFSRAGPERPRSSRHVS